VYDSWAVFVEVPFFWRTSTVYAGVRVVAVLVAAAKVFESPLAVPVEPAVTPVRTKRVESAAADFEGGGEPAGEEAAAEPETPEAL
jgi:hypothetical protein